MENSQSGGTTWSVPLQRSTIVLCYNKDLFRAGGLDPDRPPATWKQVAGHGGKLTLRDSTGKVMQWGVQIPSSEAPSWYFQALAGANEVRLTDSAGTQTRFDQPMVQDALNFWIDLIDRYKAHPAGIVEADTMVRDFIQGKIAIIYTSTDNLAQIRDQAKFDLAIARLPSNMGRGSPTGGGNFYLFKQASPAQRAAAFKFVRWMTSADQAAQWSIATGYVAVRADAWETPAMKSHVAAFPAATVARDQLQQSFGELSTHDNERVTNALDDNLRAALSGTKTPRQALQDAQRELTSCCSRSRSDASRRGHAANRSRSRSGRHTPASVINPVSSRAGVTSNAGLATGVAAGAIAWPPPMLNTSLASRSSMGMPSPLASVQSIVGEGTAA